MDWVCDNAVTGKAQWKEQLNRVWQSYHSGLSIIWFLLIHPNIILIEYCFFLYQKELFLSKVIGPLHFLEISLVSHTGIQLHY